MSEGVKVMLPIYAVVSVLHSIMTFGRRWYWMKDENLWNEAGQKGLIEFLTNADGEDNDAAVYDTKFE